MKRRGRGMGEGVGRREDGETGLPSVCVCVYVCVSVCMCMCVQCPCARRLDVRVCVRCVCLARDRHVLNLSAEQQCWHSWYCSHFPHFRRPCKLMENSQQRPAHGKMDTPLKTNSYDVFPL